MEVDWLSRFEQDLSIAFEDSERILMEMPEEFREQAINYLDRLRLLKNAGSTNYICYLLAFWLQEVAKVKPEDSRRFTVAMIFVMMYYHLIDEVMDDPNAGDKRKLPLANLLQLEFWKIYSSYFPASSPFWISYRKYTAEWAQVVALENQIDFFQVEPVRIAHKASPVKLTVAGMLMLSAKEELLSDFEKAVDMVLVTLQMLDDWEDWEKDLREGSYNALISHVQRELEIPKDRRPNHEEMKHAIYARDTLLSYAERTDHNAAVLHSTAPALPYLIDFHDYLRNSLTQGAKSLREERELLAQGGLIYWLSKNKNLS
ncbi:hypothetical protein M0651_00950 [Paenibacillus sp. MBLB2552]|uniref:Uncharacterized protein n=1 Tax=Paenibacillus mellifer TaxID=2937794 RepID=A0A9X1Y1L0_9BACL|nr:hypothetical protein [Paenibacillus mellifer]MCK8485737.1 hypothetical protein [Paenibacillus mellifer]